MSLKFKKDKQLLPLNLNDEGLTAENTVRVKGKKPGIKKKKKTKLKSLNTDDMIKRLAASTDDDDGFSQFTGKSSKSGISSKRPSSMFSGRSGRYSGKSSMKSSSKTAPTLKRFDIPEPPSNFGPHIDSDEESDYGHPVPTGDLDSDDDTMSVSTMTSSVHSLDKTLSRLKSKKPAPPTKNVFGMSDKEVDEQEKLDILARLHILKQRGTRLSKNYTVNSTLNELRMEIGRLEHEAETTRSVQRLRRWLLAGVSGMEYASSSKYAPKFARNKLNGFSTYVVDGIEDYDPAFERMSEQYSGVMGIGSTGNPLTDIFMLMLTQAFMFIFIEHKVGTKPPTMEDIKKEHPDLIRNAAREMAEQMRQEERRQEAEASAAREEARQAWINSFHKPVPMHHGVSNGFEQVINSPVQVTSQAPAKEFPGVYTPPNQPPHQVSQYKEEPIIQNSLNPPTGKTKRRGMPAPTAIKSSQSMARANSNIPTTLDNINSEDTSLFNLKPPTKGPSLETTFSQTQPIDDVALDRNMTNVTHSPIMEKENLPKVPFSVSKSVEIPTATRAGKQVKIAPVGPKKSALKNTKIPEANKEEGKSITIQ